jgi:hypothetical protein
MAGNVTRLADSVITEIERFAAPPERVRGPLTTQAEPMVGVHDL